MGWKKHISKKHLIIFSSALILISGFILMTLILNNSTTLFNGSTEANSIVRGKGNAKIQAENRIRIEKLNFYEDVKAPNSFRGLKARAKRKVDKIVHRGDKDIPILMYHYVDYSPTNEMCVPKEKFAEQMKFLKEDGYTTLSMDEVYDYFSNNAPIPEKPIVITFDDGYVDNYTNAYPILKQLGFKATIFDITSTIDTNNKFINSNQIKELDKNGIRIEAHTVTHPRLSKLSYDEQYKELRDSKKKLEGILGREVKYLAYPYGEYNDDTIKALEQLGYKVAVTTFYGRARKSDGFYNLSRHAVSSKYEIEHFKELLNGPKKK